MTQQIENDYLNTFKKYIILTQENVYTKNFYKGCDLEQKYERITGYHLYIEIKITSDQSYTSTYIKRNVNHKKHKVKIL